MVKEQYKEDWAMWGTHWRGWNRRMSSVRKINSAPSSDDGIAIRKKMISRKMDRLEVCISIEHIALDDRILVTRKKGIETCLRVLIQGTE